MGSISKKIIAVVPAAGVGKRMKSQCPKQYLTIKNQTILEHTVFKLLSHPLIEHVVIAISKGDEYFQDTALTSYQNISVVDGGAERVDSVLAGLLSINTEVFPWVMVHDAARPCVDLDDISTLISKTQQSNCGGLLVAPVRDTMKKSYTKNGTALVERTVERENLWHALTPQLYRTLELIYAITKALKNNIVITDESSAVEYAGYKSLLVEGKANNIKITRPDDLSLATFILSQQLSQQNNSIQPKGK